MLTLQIRAPKGEPFTHPLRGEAVVIGRSSVSDVVIRDEFLSRRHARLFLDGGRWMVEDLGSRNGTFVDGSQVDEPVEVGPGSVIELSGTVVSVLDEAEASAGGSESAIFRSASRLLSSTSETSIGRAPTDVALRRHAERLQVLNEVHRALGRLMPQEELLELILDRIFDHLQPEQGMIYLKGESGDYEPAASRSVEGPGAEPLHSESLIREVAVKGMAALVLDARTDDRFFAARSLANARVRSLVAAPLLDPDGALGMIVLASRLSVRHFGEEDMELLVSLASVAAMSIRNAALAEEAVERRRLEREVALARRIQQALLPKELPQLPGYDLVAGNIPSRGVSGDFYSVSPGPGGTCLLLIADVSGKGIGAALLTASIDALAAAPLADGLAPDEVFAKVSELLYARTPPEKYATALLARLDPATGRLSYANAGHSPGLVVRATGEVAWLPPNGLPLGLLDEGGYRLDEVVLGPGDTVVLYTDGLTEAEAPANEMFGEERLAEVCRDNRELPVGDLAKALNAAVDDFGQGAAIGDDRTFIVLRRVTGESARCAP